MGEIFLTDVLSEMASGEAFDITVVTADRARKTGGELLSLAGCTLAKARKKPARQYAVAGEPAPTNPNHWDNSTRNVALPNGLIRKIHIRLIIKFNGKTVLW